MRQRSREIACYRGSIFHALVNCFVLTLCQSGVVTPARATRHPAVALLIVGCFHWDSGVHEGSRSVVCVAVLTEIFLLNGYFVFESWIFVVMRGLLGAVTAFCIHLYWFYKTPKLDPNFVLSLSISHNFHYTLDLCYYMVTSNKSLNHLDQSSNKTAS